MHPVTDLQWLTILNHPVVHYSNKLTLLNHPVVHYSNNPRWKQSTTKISR